MDRSRPKITFSSFSFNFLSHGLYLSSKRSQTIIYDCRSSRTKCNHPETICPLDEFRPDEIVVVPERVSLWRNFVRTNPTSSWDESPSCNARISLNPAGHNSGFQTGGPARVYLLTQAYPSHVLLKKATEAIGRHRKGARASIQLFADNPTFTVDVLPDKILTVSMGNLSIPEVNLLENVLSICYALLHVEPVALSPDVVIPLIGNDASNLKGEDFIACKLNRVVAQESSGSAHSVSHLNSDALAVSVHPIDEVSARVVVPSILTPVTPTVQLSGRLVEVLFNLISLEALVIHMGVNSQESVRMQIDWLECSSASSTEVDEIECFDQ
ncbi:hypothetical protein MA16_Dca017810 [Dendrobium catenatum]|uniref:Uncharacterized protein n=1 Tax=Dendrobium catenatum TaxID=906689 RepID=A0A2I0VFF5_9ASPA|nr:hypothetical protein MA16_Dca017810 [Dendrobium catenatum]